MKKNNVFAEEINNTASELIDNKRMKSIDSIETYAYGMSKELVSKKRLNVRI